MFKRLPVTKLNGDEQFKNSCGIKFFVSEFWRYGFSNLNSNVLRGALAEFLVENALKDNKEITVRNPWGDYDVLTKDGKKVEVKCSSYIQDWDQNELSKIVFSGLKAKSLYWSSAVNSEKSKEKKDYKADIYVLALLKHRDPKTLDIFNLDQWCFYVLSKDSIRRVSGNGNSVSLSKLEKNNITPLHFKDLAGRINQNENC